MSKILVIYYSHTGNTEKMAKAIGEGAMTIEGTEVELKNYESPQRLPDYDAILIGAPTYHRNMTENIKRFLEEIAFHKVSLKGKVGACFGSYGWSGEAPFLVTEVMEKKFEMKVIKPPLRIKNTPDEQGLNVCRTLGKTVAEKIK